MTRRQFAALSCAAPAVAQTRRRNLVLILTDDHRFDIMGCAGHPWVRTPHLDRLRRGGALFRNAFVTTSLCSPSRASILTGLYMHAHGVRDNFSPLPGHLATFPRLLRSAGYRTAFHGKWHMGGDQDEPRPGFDEWISFRGQGEYVNPELNRNGARSRANGYMTDILTAESRRFIRENASRPFLLFLSHKAVHYPFQPAPRHRDQYARDVVPYPKTMPYREEAYQQLPDWIRRRRYSRHGVDGMFGQTGRFDDFYRDYCRSLSAVDDSVGEIMDELASRSLLNDTLVLYMGDNGYLWGEHGLIDKRSMHEPSIRVPLIAHCPDLFAGGQSVPHLALNLDIAPTLLDAGGVEIPPSMHGRSLLPLLRGTPANWRSDFLYHYEWEQDFPYTPTIFGLRTERYSLMQSWGLWDRNELYDVQKDPDQTHNLLGQVTIRHRGRMLTQIQDPALRETVAGLQNRLAELLAATGGDPRYSGKGSPGDVFAL